MFTTNLDDFKTKEKELHRQAIQFRLVRSMEQHSPFVTRLYETLGRALIHSGQQLINNTRASAH